MSEPFIHIIIQYCNDPRSARQAEYDECVRRDLSHPAVKAVHNLVEPQTVVPTELSSHSKYVHHSLNRWMTYKDAVCYANERLAGEVTCISNLDIFLKPDHDWAPLADFFHNNPRMALCQSRMEFEPPGRVYRDPELHRSGSCSCQDAWFFLAPFEISDCEFRIGTLGCDNAFAHRIKASGRIPLNAAQQYPIYHLDRVRGKDFLNQEEIHHRERGDESVDLEPRRRGQYLVPDCDQVTSLDAVAKWLQLTPLDRYQAICDLMTRFLAGDKEE